MSSFLTFCVWYTHMAVSLFEATESKPMSIWTFTSQNPDLVLHCIHHTKKHCHYLTLALPAKPAGEEKFGQKFFLARRRSWARSSWERDMRKEISCSPLKSVPGLPDRDSCLGGCSTLLSLRRVFEEEIESRTGNVAMRGLTAPKCKSRSTRLTEREKKINSLH